MTVTIDQLTPGTVISYRPDFGAGAPVLATVTGAEPNGKNGRDLADLKINATGDLRWAYLNQIDEIVSTPEG